MLVIGGQVFGGLLLVTGAAKLHRPADTANAIRQLGVPASLVLTYLLALVEVGVGSLVLFTRDLGAFAAQAALFAVFLGWVVWSMRSGVALASCGCLGRDDTPPYWGHVVVNSLGLVLSAVVFVTGMTLSYPPELLGRIVVVVLVGLGVASAWVVLDDGARLHGRTT